MVLTLTFNMTSQQEPYDVNFCFPVPEVLESERVLLTPFIVSSSLIMWPNFNTNSIQPLKHSEYFISQAILSPDVFKFLPFGPFATTEAFNVGLIENRIQKDSGYIIFAIYDKTKPSTSNNEPGAFAGIIGLINTSVLNLATEIGCVVILPAFQRTHVASNAVGILLHYTLDLPSSPSPVISFKGPTNALGLRRIVWQAHHLNKGSIRLAERMGFKLEGVLRWDRVLPSPTVGNGRDVRDGDPRKECVGRDTAMLSLCWDDWEESAKEVVDRAIARRG